MASSPTADWFWVIEKIRIFREKNTTNVNAKLTTIKSEGRSNSMSNRIPTKLSSVFSEISPYHLLFSGSEPSYANTSGQGDGGWAAEDERVNNSHEVNTNPQIVER